MSKVAEIFEKVIDIFDKPSEPIPDEVEVVEVTKAASLAASVYEKVRNVVELRDEHVLRRGAIERILIRRLGENGDSKRISEFVVREILWAGYLGKEGVPTSKVDKVSQILDKYLYLIRRVKKSFAGEEKKKLVSWLIGVCSAEVDRILVSFEKKDAIVGLMYQLVYNQVDLADEKSTQRRDVQVYLAIQRALYKSDEQFLSFLLLKLFYPEWINGDKQVWERFFERILKIYDEVEQEVNYPLADRLTKYIKKMVASFLILDEVLRGNRGKNKEIFENEEKVEEEVRKVCKKKYAQLGVRLRRAVTRSIIYIFLTKMLFGFLLEYPYDKYILKEVHLVALGINALLPPSLMFFIGTTIKVPGKDNTDRIVDRIKSISYRGELFADVAKKAEFRLKKRVKRPLLTSLFVLIYILAFVVSFGLIYWVLAGLSFSIVSMAIFFFFLTAVVFFGYRVRLIAREYVLIEKENIFAPIVDFFFVPFLKVGSWLSDAIAKINIFSYILDFIIEAQFKTIVEVVDEWIRFMKEKREEAA